MPQMTMILPNEINDFLRSSARRNVIIKAEAMCRTFSLLVW